MNKPPCIVLRDLPGIREIEQGLHLKNAEWAPENDMLQARCDQISMALFGITIEDTRPYSHGRLRDGYTDETARQFELNFNVLRLFDKEATRPFWAAMHIDPYDDDGDELLCLDEFGRQLIAVRKGLMGHEPGADAAARLHHSRTAKTFAEDLEASVKAFYRAKRSA